jgi:hypothetical protein
MWRDLVRQLKTYPSAVLTGRDTDGYPLSVRCRPTPLEDGRVIAIELSAPSFPQAGPASLLCHSHNQFLWKLRSFLVRGTLAQEAQEWIFVPADFVPGIGIGGIPGMMRFAADKRRTARRYLEQRGLARPRIPWDEIDALKRAQGIH